MEFDKQDHIKIPNFNHKNNTLYIVKMHQWNFQVGFPSEKDGLLTRDLRYIHVWRMYSSPPAFPPHPGWEFEIGEVTYFLIFFTVHPQR